ncbi:related to HNM1-Choline permease [Phialocephala subalpina]|uniref:Related to HNM1-Choline permease n=1 Tax=Phialocephala subalpina TaxID=576137 RepID=A0A1L7X0T7_9HELO|nr:related to HNM1-Choline permease [Phialocephala subalpina]
MSSKETGGVIEAEPVDFDPEFLDVRDPVVLEKRGTEFDGRDMNRMGKLPQLRRTFRFPSIFGYSVVLGATWEFSLVIVALSLMNGGTAGGIWIFLAVCVGMFFVVLSMAEMASRHLHLEDSITGSLNLLLQNIKNFSATSSVCIPEYLRLHAPDLTSLGWFAVIGWQAAMASIAFACAQQFEGLIALNLPNYIIKGWHGTLLSIGVTVFAIIWNTVLVRKLPLLEGIIVILHVFGFFAFIVVLWVMAPRSDAKVVWTDFQDNGNWGNIGLSCLVGMTGPVITLIGADSACHLSEELKDAAWVLPRSMVATATVNYIMGFVMTVTVMSTLGDVDNILSTTTGQPYIQVLLNATQSQVGTSIMTAVVAVLLLFAAVNLVTTSSRQLFAFARDKGLPFSNSLAYVRPGWDIPLNAVLTTLAITTLISLIIIGSSIAFNVIVSIGQVGTVASYIVAIACIARKRLVKEPLLPSRFNLGKAGLTINLIALAFLTLAFVFPFFPAQSHPNAAEMNWNILVTGFTMGVAMIYYVFRARFTYRGPVEYVRRL